jgi:hypothetical protein
VQLARDREGGSDLAGMGRGLTVIIAVLVVILLIVLAIPFIA